MTWVYKNIRRRNVYFYVSCSCYSITVSFCMCACIRVYKVSVRVCVCASHLIIVLDSFRNVTLAVVSYDMETLQTEMTYKKSVTRNKPHTHMYKTHACKIPLLNILFFKEYFTVSLQSYLQKAVLSCFILALSILLSFSVLFLITSSNFMLC